MSLGQNYKALTDMVATPVGTFICPSRRQAIAYPYNCNPGYMQLLARPPATGHTDYAANGGDGPCAGSNPNVPGSGAAPGSYVASGTMSDAQISAALWGSNHPTGVINAYSQCKITDITDGASNTFLIGEKYMGPDWYYSGTDGADDAGWASGYDYDVDRWVACGSTMEMPMQDTPGYGGGLELNFGSAHANSLNMAFCDGSVQSISYSIDPQTWDYLGNREDGQSIDPRKAAY